MKIHFENRYSEDDALIAEFAKKVVLKNTSRFALIIAFTGIGLMGISIAQGQMLMVTIFGVTAFLMLAARAIMPNLLASKIKKNNLKETGGGENVFQFGRVIHIEQGNVKADLEYDMLGKFTELKSGYVFKLGKLSYMVLKKGCFTVGDWNGLKAFIKEKRPDLRI